MVWSRLREARGPVSSTTRPASIESCTEATIASGTRRSRNSITSGKLCPVSTCMTANGSGAGRERLLGQRQQQDRVLPAGEQQHGLLQLGRHLADDVDRLRLELLEMRRERYTAHSPSPRITWNGTLRCQSMKCSIVSRPNSTGSARSRTSSSNAFVPTRSANALNASPSVRWAS